MNCAHPEKWIDNALKPPLEVEAIFFDLDGTLCDNDGATLRANQDALEYLLSRFPTLTPARVRNTYEKIRKEEGLSLRESSNLATLFHNGSDLRRERFKRLLHVLSLPEEESFELAERYGRAKTEHLETFPEVHSVLRRLRESFALGVITNGFSDIQREQLRTLQLESYFDHIVISQELGAWKPSSKIFRYALSQASTKPSKALMVGDTPEHDIATPKKLGMHTCLVTRNSETKYDGEVSPDFILQHLGPLPSLVRASD